MDNSIQTQNLSLKGGCFDTMPVDSFTDQRLNIKDIGTIEPRKSSGIVFDMERDITKEDWEKKIDPRLNKYLNTLNESSYYPGPGEEVLQFFQALAVLAPDKVKRAVTDEHWSKMKEFFDGPPERALKTAATMRLLDPERAKDEHLVSEEQWESIRNSYFTFAFLAEVIEIGADARLFDPESTNDYRLEDSEKWNGVQKSIDSMKNAERWYYVARTLAAIKIVDPKRAIDFKPDEETWDAFHRLLDSYRNHNSQGGDFSFATLASYMAILAADEVNITEKGLELKTLTHRPELNPKEEMPEVRRF